MNFRKEVFKANMEKAKILNERNPRAQFGVTIFSDQTESEMKKRMGAIAPTKPENAEYHQGRSKPMKNIDWRKDMEPIQDQGACGSCWAFSATASFETRYKLSQKEKLTKLSEQEVLDCTSDQYGCNGGWYTDAFDMLKSTYFCTEDSYPYETKKGKCRSDTCDQVAEDSGYKLVKDEEGLYDALHDGPISIAVDASTWSSYQGGVLTECGTGMNHAVVIAGYDKKSNAWIIRNSWGSSWGEDGYIRVIYGENMCNLNYKSAYPTF